MKARVPAKTSAGCAVAAVGLWLVGLVVAASFWTLVIVCLWKLAHHL